MYFIIQKKISVATSTQLISHHFPPQTSSSQCWTSCVWLCAIQKSTPSFVVGLKVPVFATFSWVSCLLRAGPQIRCWRSALSATVSLGPTAALYSWVSVKQSCPGPETSASSPTRTSTWRWLPWCSTTLEGCTVNPPRLRRRHSAYPWPAPP